jgi:hypothetical protein
MVLEAALPQCLVKTFTTALDAMVQVRAADALKALLKTASASTLMALQPLMSPLRALASDGSRLRVNVRPYAIEALGYMAMNDELAAQLVRDEGKKAIGSIVPNKPKLAHNQEGKDSVQVRKASQ